MLCIDNKNKSDFKWSKWSNMANNVGFRADIKGLSGEVKITFRGTEKVNIMFL